ncbi:putative ankyrin repeat protein RF_0381 [Microplitis mediator]|uniref:putative ankyrin repeat protein RF_0381 n=1 Tax=Microplitis mediator TaxID=375433 RepID=UPI002552BCB2|nr:putative ankyrin repeat protein RF_0381 [Microplitis mediator]
MEQTYAVNQNDEEIPEFLLKRDDDASSNSNPCKLCNAKTLMQIAVDQSKEEMVELLLKAYGADVNSLRGPGVLQVSPLHFAVQCLNSEAVELILNDCVVDINIVNKCKNSALHYAVSATVNNIIRQLLNAGVDINLKNVDGTTAFTLKVIHSQKVNDTITEHIAKLSAANFYVNEQNLAVVHRKKFGELRDQCLSEIEKMKITYVGTSNVTIYNVLCNKCEHKLAVSLSYVSDSTILDLDLQSLFPLYGGMISYRLQKALGRKKLLFNAISLTNDIFDEIQHPNK